MTVSDRTPQDRRRRMHWLHPTRPTYCGARHITIIATLDENLVTCTGCRKIFDREMLNQPHTVSEV